MAVSNHINISELGSPLVSYLVENDCVSIIFVLCAVNQVETFNLELLSSIPLLPCYDVSLQHRLFCLESHTRSADNGPSLEQRLAIVNGIFTRFHNADGRRCLSGLVLVLVRRVERNFCSASSVARRLPCGIESP